MREASAVGHALWRSHSPTWEQRSNWPPRTRRWRYAFTIPPRRNCRGGVRRKTRNGMSSRPLSRDAACVPQSEEAMALSNHLPKLRIALLFGAALVPALSLAQSVQAPPLPKAPPEIMSKEAHLSG